MASHSAWQTCSGLRTRVIGMCSLGTFFVLGSKRDAQAKLHILAVPLFEMRQTSYGINLHTGMCQARAVKNGWLPFGFPFNYGAKATLTNTAIMPLWFLYGHSSNVTPSKQISLMNVRTERRLHLTLHGTRFENPPPSLVYSTGRMVGNVLAGTGLGSNRSACPAASVAVSGRPRARCSAGAMPKEEEMKALLKESKVPGTVCLDFTLTEGSMT